MVSHFLLIGLDSDCTRVGAQLIDTGHATNDVRDGYRLIASEIRLVVCKATTDDPGYAFHEITSKTTPSAIARFGPTLLIASAE